MEKCDSNGKPRLLSGKRSKQQLMNEGTYLDLFGEKKKILSQGKPSKIDLTDEEHMLHTQTPSKLSILDQLPGTSSDMLAVSKIGTDNSTKTVEPYIYENHPDAQKANSGEGRTRWPTNNLSD